MINRFIKNNFKIMIAVSLTAIICISGTVFATGYFASDVKYKKEDGTEINVDYALNDLYQSKKEKKSGELFLKMALENNITLSHNHYDGYTGTINISELDFSDIKSFQYTFLTSTNRTSDQGCCFYDENTGVQIDISTSNVNSKTVDTVNWSNIGFNMWTSGNGSNFFKIISYTTNDNIVHKI